MRAMIIGGGIGGLCAALALRQSNVDVVVYERTVELREVGAGLAVWSNAVKALDKLGVGAAIRAYGVPNAGGSFRTTTGSIIIADNTTNLEQRFGAPALVMHRAELLNILRQALPAEVIQLGKVLTRFEQDASSVTAYFADGSSATADVLIGADGIHSVVRSHLFPQAKARYAGYTAWRAITPYAYPQHADFWGEVWGSGARFGIAPLTNNRIYWFATANTQANMPIPPQGHKAFLQQKFGTWQSPIPALLAATDDAAILQNDILELTPLANWTHGRITLLGDAAHAMTPNLGQGACQAMEDAVALGQAFQTAPDIPQALHAYQTRRLPRANRIALLSRRIGQVGQLDNPVLCALRDTVFRFLPTSVRDSQLDEVVGYTV